MNQQVPRTDPAVAGTAAPEAASPGTATALIEAGRELFARHGYDGTSVRAITAAAQANLGAISYHFGSKRELYDRVVASVATPLAERVERVVTEPGTALVRIGGVVRTYFQYLAENADLPQLMMQELVLSAQPAEVVAGPLKRIHRALTGLIEEGQGLGEVRRGPPMALSIFILSVPVHLGMLRPALKAHMGLDLLEPEVRARVTAAAVEFVCAGLSGGGS